MESLISMKLSASEAKEEVSAEPEAPKYPWGLCLDLDSETLKKLGITTLPEVGSVVHIIASADVQSASQSQYQSDKEMRMSVSLQITDMAVSADTKDWSKVMYDGK